MKRSVSVSRVVSHPSTLAVFSGLLGALIGFLLNLASGGKTSQLLWTALVFAIMFSLSLTAWQVYRQEQTGKQWMTMLQEMVFQTYFLTLLADKPEISQLARQRLGRLLPLYSFSLFPWWKCTPCPCPEQGMRFLPGLCATGLPRDLIGDGSPALRTVIESGSSL
jgi:hypothetical protein